MKLVGRRILARKANRVKRPLSLEEFARRHFAGSATGVEVRVPGPGVKDLEDVTRMSRGQ